MPLSAVLARRVSGVVEEGWSCCWGGLLLAGSGREDTPGVGTGAEAEAGAGMRAGAGAGVGAGMGATAAAAAVVVAAVAVAAAAAAAATGPAEVSGISTERGADGPAWVGGWVVGCRAEFPREAKTLALLKVLTWAGVVKSMYSYSMYSTLPTRAMENKTSPIISRLYNHWGPIRTSPRSGMGQHEQVGTQGISSHEQVYPTSSITNRP